MVQNTLLKMKGPCNQHPHSYTYAHTKREYQNELNSPAFPSVLSFTGKDNGCFSSQKIQRKQLGEKAVFFNRRNWK